MFDLLARYSNSFSKDNGDLEKTQIAEHTIHTGDAPPIRRPRRTLLAFKGEEKREIQSMLEKGIIRMSTSLWASPIALVKKKKGEVSFCIDYRHLNEVTIKDSYPLPRIEDCLDALVGAKFFSSMDLASGYWQIPVKEEDKEKTAFVSKSGLLEFNMMPFGLTNAPGTFERAMEAILQGLQWQTCLIYLDDIIVFGKTVDEAMQRLRDVLDRVEKANLKLKPSKCYFLQEEVLFLGHLVSEKGVRADTEKLKVLELWPQPVSDTQIKSFLGFCSYYR